MKIGTYYYPEQWPRSQWQRDFDTIVNLGLQIVHMAEFAWATLQPKPGQFDLDWLQECVEHATKRKLDVILCTPTAVPPVWLLEQSPEILLVDQNGMPARHGGRRHYSPTSPAMQRATKEIVSALAERFGDHPSVIGWQIDNEYSAPFDQSEHTHAAFRQWLKQKYESLEGLNCAWGTQFWNTFYTSWSQVLMPPTRDPGYGNPHQHLDASRFWSAAFAHFNKIQTDILLPRIGSRFLTTNFMPFHLDCDPADMAPDFTLTSWDSYPVTGWDVETGHEHHRIASPSAVGFTHDQMASYHNRWALMELQPGTVNWSGVPSLVYPGAIRLWIWTAFAHGAEFVTTYRLRQPLWGTELFHHGLIETDGHTPSPGGRQFAQVAEEIRRLDQTRVPSLVEQPVDSATTVGLVFDFDQLWYFKTLPQAKRWDMPAWLTSWYAAITRLGLNVKILRPGAPWPDGLGLIVVPSLQMMDDDTLDRLRKYAANGGHLVLTCRTAWMNKSGQLWEGKTAQPILPLIGGEIEAYDALPAGHDGKVDLDGKKFSWGAWAELLYAAPDSRVLAKYTDQFYAGAAAVIQNKVGKGVVTYCGVCAEPAFVEALMEKLAGQTSLHTTLLRTRVQLLRRGPYRILLNYQDQPFDVPAAAGSTFLVGSRRVPPAGVAVWEE